MLNGAMVRIKALIGAKQIFSDINFFPFLVKLFF